MHPKCKYNVIFVARCDANLLSAFRRPLGLRQHTRWGGHLFEGFVANFLKVPLACWGSSVAAVQPNSLGNSQKTFYKTLGTSGFSWKIQNLILISG